MDFRKHIQLAFLLLTFLSLLLTTSGKQKPINVALSGKWKSTPLILETSEFFAKESNDLFWRFVDHVGDQGRDYFELAKDEVKYRFVLEYAEKVLSPLQLSFLKFSLSLRAFSPAIQMFQQLAEQIPSTESCSTFIEVNGEFSCDSNSLSELLTTSPTRSPTPIYKFDHIYPGKAGGKKSPVVILYTELGTNDFKEFHPALSQLAKLGEITYCIRHFVKDVNDKNVRLSGYGVELAIKSTEYKAKDDTKVEGESPGDSSDEDDEGEEVNGIVFSKMRELHPELKNELKELKNHLLDSATELTPFKVWQLQDLGFQAGQKIMSVSQADALQYLRDISQNFPTQARSLVRQSVTSEFKKEVKRNQQAFERMGLAAGASNFYLNGLSVDLETYDVFTLLDVMTSEASLVEGLHSLGYQGDRLQKLLQLDLREGNDQSYAVDMRHTAVQYLNDLSVDKVYRAWPNSVQDLLRPSFPGMLRHVAKNLFHLVIVVDPVNPDSKSLIKMAEAFVVHKAPLRMGLVLVCDSDAKSEEPVTGYSSACVAFTRAFNFILMDKGSAAPALSFMTDVFQKLDQSELIPDAIIKEFTSQYPGEDTDLIFGDNNDYDDIRKAGIDFVSRIGLTGLPQVLINGVPLDKEQVQMENFEESVVMEVLKQTQILQTAVYKGQVTDDMDILDWWMERDNVLPRLNSRILAPASNRLDFSGSMGDDLKRLTPSQASRLDSKSLTAFVADKMKYISKKDEDSVRPVTFWVLADLETTEGRYFLYSAIRHLKTSNNGRLGLVFNPSETSLEKNLINRAVNVALQTLSMPLAKSLVTKLVKEENVEGLMKGTKTLRDLEVHGMDMDAYMKAFDAETDNFLKIDQMFASRVLSLQNGERAVITNGAILGPLSENEEMTMEDFNLLEKVSSSQGASKIQEALTHLRGAKENEKSSDAVMKVSNLLLSKSKQEKRHKVDHEGDIHSVIKLDADSNLPAFTVEAVINPVSREAQKLASILLVIQEIANVNVRIYLNPLDKLSEMPLKSFYRYVLEPEVTFNTEGMLNDGPSARFMDMPQKSLLTLAMDTPESWLVEAVTSPYDLDNILLEEVERSVTADFELEYLLLEGHCHDASTMQPPRGLQFVLGTNSSVAVVDTIVMANLGYFQLKANPGLWQLRLREGRSNEIYNIESHEFTDTPDGLSDVIIGISSFKSKTIRVKVSKKPDKADQSLLQDNNDDGGGLWDSFTNTFSGGSAKSDEDKEDSTLNIFSVASGHLYERFLRIMMLSVLKNTQSKVKFWFLKNFLSPSFKDFIPYMAQEYGFEYELVQYKWPHWLNQQKEKQRIIWGYKILFLDVLFPLDVKKIIFVDADQIVRADLQELHDLDLGGAPYGYTPFCDSKKEMDGFRFWNSGYWKSHLAGRKYHISALYVVDLKRFRRIAAGDRLRGQYQGLSQDPNSLANLDQDLPNNMIHQVSIKSLPQEWLYCETWCSESTKPQAKTIDLCNNPLTKEPKLKAAMRIVPEWKNYDYEVKVLWDDIYNTDTKSQIEYDPPEGSSQSDNRRKPKEEL